VPLSDREIERLVREALSARGEDAPPPARLRSRVLRDASAASRARRASGLARVMLPYAAGVLTVLGLEALRHAPVPPPAPLAAPSFAFESIADRRPPTAPDRDADASGDPGSLDAVYEPVPRIS
jgi:hypothetical protein